MKMLKNKKGFEFPHSVWYTFVTCVLIIFSLIIIYSFMTSICPTIQYKMFNMKYNALASKLIYSDCMAYEENYAGPLGDQRIVHAALLDINKISGEDAEPNIISCADLKSTVRTTMEQGSGEGNIEQNFGIIVSKFNDDLSESVILTVPSGVTCAEKDYAKDGRIGNFLVRIRESDESIANGKVTLCVNMKVPTFRAEC